MPELGNDHVPEEESSIPERAQLTIPVNNCSTRKEGRVKSIGFLIMKELAAEEETWVALAQQQAFAVEIGNLKVG